MSDTSVGQGVLPENNQPTSTGQRELIASMLLSGVFGIVHSFSLFVAPLEAQFQAGRADVSLTYSLALMMLTLFVLQGHRIYKILPPHILALACFAVAGAGVAFSALARELWMVWIGYGVVFGAANGVAYGFSLQFAAQSRPGKPGFPMGLVTASYALGATLSPILFSAALDRGGFPAAMAAHGLIFAAAAPVVLVLLRGTPVVFRVGTKAHDENADPVPWARIVRLWIGYGTAVMAGLMLISQAAEIATEAGASSQLATATPAVLALANLTGALLGGAAIDKWRARVVLAGLSLTSGSILIGLSFGTTAILTVGGLCLVGFLYGATIAAYPATIAATYGTIRGVRIYGLVFTAWGTAGLAAPYAAGALFDASGGYQSALMLAALAGIMSAGVIAFAPLRSRAVATL